MMEVRPIHLSDEELNFELELRGVTGLGPLTHRNKCARLEKVMQDDQSVGRVYSTSANVADSASEVNICQSRVNRLMPQIVTGIERRNVNFLEPIVSRLNHYYNRLTLVNPPPDDMREEWRHVRDTIAHTQRQIHRILNPANASLSQYSVSSVSNSTAPAHNSTAVDNNTSQRSNAADQEGAVGGLSTGANPKRTPLRSNFGQQHLSGPVSGQVGSTAAQAHSEPGLPANRLSLPLGRGRGRSTFDHIGQQRQVPVLGQDITAPPRLEVDPEYNQLRDQLLCHLLERDRLDRTRKETDIPKRSTTGRSSSGASRNRRT